MRKIRKKICILVVMISLIFINSISLFAHSGRTDKYGGHKDNKNASGLGSYHYHCGGHPAHLHTNGVCPYSSNSQSTKTTTTSTKASSKTPAKSATSTTKSTPVTTPVAPEVSETPKPKIIEAESVVIQDTETKMRIGENKKLVGKVLPENTNDKSITWTSSDTKVITIGKTGEITAVGSGKSTITAITQNGKIASIVIEVIDERKEEISSVTSKNGNSTTSASNDNSSENAVLGLVAIGGISAGGYYIYNKNKKK